MTIDHSMNHTSPSPAPEVNCRRAAYSITRTVSEKFINPRKRLDFRRILSDTDDDYTKMRRTERRHKGELLTKKTYDTSSFALSSVANDNSVENENIVNGSSSSVIDKDREREKKRRVTCGWISVIGRRREMEDTVAIHTGFLKWGSKEYDFFGVYDGHGGSRVAQACCEQLHGLVANEFEEEKQMGNRGGGEKRIMMINWEKVMGESFKRMDDEVNRSVSPTSIVGSTAVVAVVGEEELVIVNCGDSRAVLARDGMAIALSDDHKPDRPDELERIERCGGKVINWNGNRVFGVLATSRAIGDICLKPFVTAEPEVRVYKRMEKDEFLILASDGLWDVISNDAACNIVRGCLNIGRTKSRKRKRESGSIDINNPRGESCSSSSESYSESDEDASSAAAAAATLTKLAMSRDSEDNISVIVVELNQF